jgi:hypothetical protein
MNLVLGPEISLGMVSSFSGTGKFAVKFDVKLFNANDELTKYVVSHSKTLQMIVLDNVRRNFYYYYDFGALPSQKLLDGALSPFGADCIVQIVIYK